MLFIKKGKGVIVFIWQTWSVFIVGPPKGGGRVNGVGMRYMHSTHPFPANSKGGWKILKIFEEVQVLGLY